MKRKRCSEEKIISILKEHEAGASAADLAYLWLSARKERFTG